MKIGSLDAIVSGEGRVLLLLHGYLCSKEIFNRQIEYFSKYFKVVAIDFIGFGNQKMPFPYSLDDYKQSLVNVIQSLRCDKIFVLAHSFGARVLLSALSDEKTAESVDKIVLVGAAGLKPKRSIKTRYKIAKYKIIKAIFHKRREDLGSSDYQKLDPIMKESFKMIVNEHLDKRLGNVKNKALIVVGSLDKETPPYMAKKLHKLLKNSALVEMSGCGHFAFLEKSGQFNVLIKEFLLNDLS